MQIDLSVIEKLATLRKRLGASERTETFAKMLDPLEEITIKLATQGLEVSLAEIENVGGLLTYKGEVLAILYIFASNSSEESLRANSAVSSGTPKFHISWCRTLDDMTAKNRFGRYVLSREPSQLFSIEALERDPLEIKSKGERHIVDDVTLYPCKNCLDFLQYRGYDKRWSANEKNQGVEDFRIGTFLEENDGNLTVMKHFPKDSAKTAASGAYTSDFSEISRGLREKCNWKCSACNVDMALCKQGLHVHHVNGVKSDNSTSNLKVLCALCHKNIDEFHKAMFVKPKIERFILGNRSG